MWHSSHHDYATVNSALHPSGVAKSSTSFGWGKGGNVTSARWQITLCDPIWYVSSRSGDACLQTAIRIFTLLYFLLLFRCFRLNSRALIVKWFATRTLKLFVILTREVAPLTSGFASITTWSLHWKWNMINLVVFISGDARCALPVLIFTCLSVCLWPLQHLSTLTHRIRYVCRAHFQHFFFQPVT